MFKRMRFPQSAESRHWPVSARPTLGDPVRSRHWEKNKNHKWGYYRLFPNGKD